MVANLINQIRLITLANLYNRFKRITDKDTDYVIKIRGWISKVNNKKETI